MNSGPVTARLHEADFERRARTAEAYVATLQAALGLVLGCPSECTCQECRAIARVALEDTGLLKKQAG